MNRPPEHWSSFSAKQHDDQGDQMCLSKNCIPTYLFVEIMHNFHCGMKKPPKILATSEIFYKLPLENIRTKRRVVAQKNFRIWSP
jgi:hypothetical protein